MIGISAHSWASENDDMLVSASIEGSSRWPPDAQFSMTSSGHLLADHPEEVLDRGHLLSQPSPRDSAPSHPMPMLSL